MQIIIRYGIDRAGEDDRLEITYLKDQSVNRLLDCQEIIQENFNNCIIAQARLLKALHSSV